TQFCAYSLMRARKCIAEDSGSTASRIQQYYGRVSDPCLCERHKFSRRSRSFSPQKLSHASCSHGPVDRLDMHVPQARGYSDCLAALTVFAISIAMVIGPTPPGTGVIALAFFDTSSNATSPTRRYPRSLAWSSTRLMPTSITTTPSRT